jgi:hypothetical protein
MKPYKKGDSTDEHLGANLAVVDTGRSLVVWSALHGLSQRYKGAI